MTGISSTTSIGTKFQLRGISTQTTIIFVHGLGLNKEMWQWLPKELEENFRIVIYDLFGHGDSPLPDEFPSLRMYSLQIKNLIEHCKVEKIILAGFSLGGMIVRRFTQDFPELVEGLMIFNSPHYRTKEQQLSIEERVKLTTQFGPKATISAAITRWFNVKFQLENPDIIGTIKQWVVNNDPSIYPKIYKILAFDLEEIIKPDPPIACPTLVVTADKDYGNDPTMSKAIANEINKSQLYILKNLKHMALVEDPEQFGSIIRDFLVQFVKVKRE